MSKDQEAVIERMKAMGFEGKALPICQYTVPGTFMTVEFDLSAIAPEHVLAAIVGQAYRAGYDRGRAAQQELIQNAIGIRR